MFIEDVFARTAKRDRVKVGEFHLEKNSIVLKKNPIKPREHIHNNTNSIGTDVAILDRLQALRQEYEVEEAHITISIKDNTYWTTYEQYYGKGSLKHNHNYGFAPQRFLPLTKWKNSLQRSLFV